MKKELKEKIVCVVILGIIVIGSGWFGGLVGMKFVECPEYISAKAEVAAMPAIATASSVELENKTVQIEANVMPEVETTTAKDIGLEFVQLRYEKPFLYLTAITDIKDKSPIFMETIESNEIREINLGRFGIMPQSTGKIDIKHPVTIRENCRIRLNFYRQGEKIATMSSPPVINGKAIFVPVLLTTEEVPSQWQIRISSQSYDGGKLILRGETNIPNEELISVSIDYIGQWQDSRIEKFSTTPNSNSGLINFERGLILSPGRYKITASYEDRDYILGMGVTKDSNGTRTTDWIKNVYVPA